MFNGGGVAHHDKKKPAPHRKSWWQQALANLKKGTVVKGPTLDKLTANLRNLGLNGWNKPLTQLGSAVARDATLQQVAAGVIDTDRITSLLTSNPTLWPDPTKPITGDAIHTILHQLGYAVQGKDALEWLSQGLVDQLALRRSLMNVAHHIKQQYDERRKILTQAIKRQKQLQDEIAGLNNQLHPKGKHAKAPTGAHKKALTDKLNKARKQLVGVSTVISVTQNQIGNLNTAWGVDLGGGSLPSMYNMYGPTEQRRVRALGRARAALPGAGAGGEPVPDRAVRAGADQRATRLADELVRRHRRHARSDQHVRQGHLHRASGHEHDGRFRRRRPIRTRSNFSASRRSATCSTRSRCRAS